MSYLIDTDIIIYSLHNNEIVNGNFNKNLNLPKAVSVITYGELIYGASKSKNRAKNMAIVHRIAELLPIIEISKTIIETFGEFKAKLQLEGSPIDDMDLLIASTALVYNYTLVTNNEKHFSRIPGLKIKNWSK